MKKRLIEFLAYLGIGQKKFEQNCGLSNGYVDKIGDNITIKSLNKISSAYPELNIAWLQTGIGSMLVNEEKDVSLPAKATQLELDFSKIADACQKTANAVNDLAKSNKILVTDNSKVLNMLVDSIARLEDKIDKRGALPESRDML